MSGKSRQTTRKPATKFPNLQKKLQKGKVAAGKTLRKKRRTDAGKLNSGK